MWARLAPQLVFVIAILQSVETGTFLTLDVVTHSLQQKWGFDGDEMVQASNVGYSLGFAGVALYCMFFLHRFSVSIMIGIGTTMTTVCWILIRVYLCRGCLYWFAVSVLEAGIGMGTALCYTAGVSLVKRQTQEASARKWKVLTLALSVALGSVLAFMLFELLPSTELVLDLMIGLGAGAGLLLLGASFIYVETSIPLLAAEAPDRAIFTWPFTLYLFGVNISFGVIVTLITSASNMIRASNSGWNPQTPLVCLVLGNLLGRVSGFFLQNHLRKLLFLFAGLSFVLSCLQMALTTWWYISVIFANLIVGAVFFGLIWSLTMALSRDFFLIAEDRAIGNIFIGMAIGPLIYGPFSAWIYDRHAVHDHCDGICYRGYLIFAAITSSLASFAYLAAWYVQKDRTQK